MLETIMARMRGRRSIAVGALFLLAVLASALGACSSGSSLREPASPGPYGVGIAHMTFTRASSTTGLPRVLDTVIWYPVDDEGNGEPVADAPPATKGAPFPVVLFSHGSGGEPDHASYLTEHLASWGFVVVAPAHPGNTQQDGNCDVECLADSFINRGPDVIFTLDQVLALKDDESQSLGAIIDAERTAVTGFSFGGMTAVRAAPEGRFDAIAGLAPAAPEALIEIGRALDVPILVAAGGGDIAVPSDQVQRFYEALPGGIPRYYLYFPRATHTSFQNECQEGCELSQERAHELINRYVTAFLEAYVIRDGRYLRYLEQGEPPDVELRAGGTAR